MKYVFSTKNVDCSTFFELCNVTKEYGFSGFEVYDAFKEKTVHADSIFSSSARAGSKRKLINRRISVSALSFPTPVGDKTNSADLVKYVDYALRSDCRNVIISLCDDADVETIKNAINTAIKSAESLGVKILIETTGKYAYTQTVLDVISEFETASLGVCWDIRQTYFVAGESADKTIQTLGAYINYVRLGDMLDGKNVLIGDGLLPVQDFINALKSLNYEGYVCAEWNETYSSYDTVLTHFINYICLL